MQLCDLVVNALFESCKHRVLLLRVSELSCDEDLAIEPGARSDFARYRTDQAKADEALAEELEDYAEDLHRLCSRHYRGYGFFYG